ncbi:MAG: hypothetical protein ED557_12810 [Balneola sp.]|nr:MAG: hypothetical protein ED557_12810 [Balneola sp.]
MSEQEFYIGWQEDMPPSNKKFLKRIITALFLLIPILVFMMVISQRPFNDHHFEFGTLSELTGVYVSDPVPMLMVEDGVPEGFSKNVLLVGFGKFGAGGIIDAIEEEQGSLEYKEVTLSGTLIYGDGVTMMELTNLEESFVSSKESEIPIMLDEPVLREFSWYGEILDPKCYFGVMKPGEGKIHKSCAIRCISGGIPPVMRVLHHNASDYQYYIVKGVNGEDINQEVLPYVAETIQFDGFISIQNGWNVIYLDMDSVTTQRYNKLSLYKELKSLDAEAYELYSN